MTLNGWDIFYNDIGLGPAVIFLHGLLMDHTMFDAQVEALSDRYRLITPDLRGHGKSEARAEPYTQWDLMEDHIALLDHLGIDQAVFAGLSQGGFQSLRAAIKHPERVRGLILMETQAGRDDDARIHAYTAMAEVVAESGWNEVILHAAAAFMFAADTPDAIKQLWIARWSELEPSQAKELLAAVNDRDDITDRLGEIRAPALVIHGAEDAAIPTERARQMADGLPNLIEFVELPKAGHSASVEDPTGVTDAIEGFLEQFAGN